MYLDQQQAPNINQLTAFRRDLHMHPELKYEENRTADKIAAYLTALGIPMVRGLGFGADWGDRPLTAEYLLQEVLSAIRSARRLLVDAAEILLDHS